MPREKRLAPDGRLPPVFPVVLYNGDPRWTMPLDMAPLIGLPSDSPLWQWQPSMRYRILNEGGIAEAGLADRDTLAALLFRLESSPDPDEIAALVGEVIDWFRRHDGFEALKPIFGSLAARTLVSSEALPAGQRVVEDLWEIKAMLANRPAQWKEQWTREGRIAGEATVLTRLLEKALRHGAGHRQAENRHRR